MLLATQRATEDRLIDIAANLRELRAEIGEAPESLRPRLAIKVSRLALDLEGCQAEVGDLYQLAKRGRLAACGVAQEV